MLKALRDSIPPSQELDLLHIFPLIINEGQIVTAFAGADPREAQGFNTKEEAQKAARYQKELQQGRRNQQPYTTALEEKRAQLIAFQGQTIHATDSSLVSAMQKRLKKALALEYHAVVFDVDENLTDSTGNIPDRVVSQLINLARRKIPIAFISGRREKSLDCMLLSKIRQRIGSETELLDYFYVYPAESALGFKLSNPDHKFYERKFPRYLSSFAMSLIRQHLLAFEDLYHVTDHKITIWPHEKDQQPILAALINELLKMAKIPLVARISSSINTNAAIILTSSESNSEVHKGVGLNDFAMRTGLSIDQIVKIADRGGKNGADHELLVGNGSFSSEAFDPLSKDQIALVLLANRKNLAAVEWLLPQIKFTSS